MVSAAFRAGNRATGLVREQVAYVDDAVYPSAFVDGAGQPLDGARDYLLHFDQDGLFPSHSGVWSISAYRENAAGQPLARRPVKGAAVPAAGWLSSIHACASA